MGGIACSYFVVLLSRARHKERATAPRMKLASQKHKERPIRVVTRMKVASQKRQQMILVS